MAVDTVFLEGSGCECDVTLDTWLRDSLGTLPGAVRSVAARELVLACREFFERSYAWQARIENQNSKVGRHQYWTSPYDQYSNVVAVLGIEYNGNALTRLTARPPRVAGESTSPVPTSFYASVAPDSVELWPDLEAAEEDVLTFIVALTPKTTVEHLPRIAEIKFFDAIMDGFLARMYAHPGKPYTDKAEAKDRRRAFNHWIGRYMGQAKQGYISAQNWSFPPSWGVRRFGQGGA